MVNDSVPEEIYMDNKKSVKDLRTFGCAQQLLDRVSTAKRYHMHANKFYTSISLAK